MESYVGYVQTVNDALRLFEAVSLGILPTTNRRLSGTERRAIRSGSVFIFDETASGVQRWTDGLRWSASRLNGHFLIYHQKGADHTHPPRHPLIKRTISVVTADKRKMVLICYYSLRDVDANRLLSPTMDARLRGIIIPHNYYFRRITQMIAPNLESSFMLNPLNGSESNFPNIRFPIKNSPPSDPWLTFASPHPTNPTHFQSFHVPRPTPEPSFTPILPHPLNSPRISPNANH
ncbi:Gluconate transport-inducing protein, partial [Massospora cicadina]